MSRLKLDCEFFMYDLRLLDSTVYAYISKEYKLRLLQTVDADIYKLLHWT